MANRNSTSKQLPLPINGEVFEILLTRGYISIVDAIDADLSKWLWCAEVDKSGNAYAIRVEYTKGQKPIIRRLHREIIARIIGRKLTNKEQVDHINHNGCDNRRSNLRLATAAQNVQNRKRPKNNTTGYKGVTRARGAFQASIEANGKSIYLGRRKTVEEAYALYCEAAKELHGEFASFD